MKVDCPRARSSPAPMRVRMRSIGPIVAFAAGTKLPMQASSTISAFWRMKVLLPPMFGPVITYIRVSPSKRRSLGSNGASRTPRPPDGGRARS
jgi:hypothetical protein